MAHVLPDVVKDSQEVAQVLVGLWQGNALYGGDLLRVDLDAVRGDPVSEALEGPEKKLTFVCIEA